MCGGVCVGAWCQVINDCQLMHRLSELYLDWLLGGGGGAVGDEGEYHHGQTLRDRQRHIDREN